MIYEYRCEPCDHAFDVIKPVAEIERPESCPKCLADAKRAFAPRRVWFSGTSVENAEWNPGLGCVVKNKQHRKELAKAKGLVEIGSDYKSGESLQAAVDSERQSKRDKEWDAL